MLRIEGLSSNMRRVEPVFRRQRKDRRDEDDAEEQRRQEKQDEAYFAKLAMEQSEDPRSMSPFLRVAYRRPAQGSASPAEPAASEEMATPEEPEGAPHPPGPAEIPLLSEATPDASEASQSDYTPHHPEAQPGALKRTASDRPAKTGRYGTAKPSPASSGARLDTYS